MKLIIDAHLPKSICNYFHDCDCIHTKDLSQGNNTKDSFINEISIKEKRALITKDTDFYYSFLASNMPYKLVLIKFGNMRIAEIKEYFARNSRQIQTLLEKHSFIILEKGKIRVLE